MAYSGRQKGRRTVHVDVRLAGEGEVEPGEAQSAQRAGAAEGLGAAGLGVQKGEFLRQHVQRALAAGQQLPVVQAAHAVPVAGDFTGGQRQLIGEIGRHLCQLIGGHRRGGQAAFLPEAVRVVAHAPQQAEAGVHRQHRAEGGGQHLCRRAPFPLGGDDVPYAVGGGYKSGAYGGDDQHLAHGEAPAAPQPPQPLLRRTDRPVPQGVHGRPAGAQGEVNGKERRQRQKPAAQRPAAHRGSALPVKHMTQWARTMTLPVSSVISAEQKASLPPRRSTLPTAVRVLPAAAAAR